MPLRVAEYQERLTIMQDIHIEHCDVDSLIQLRHSSFHATYSF